MDEKFAISPSAQTNKHPDSWIVAEPVTGNMRCPVQPALGGESRERTEGKACLFDFTVV